MSDFYTAKLQDIAMVLVSNVDKKTYSSQKKVVLCNYMDVYSNDYITADLAFMESTASDKEISQFTLRKGDIVITKDSESPFDIGIPAVVVDDIPNLVCGYHLAIIRPDLTQVDPYYLAKQLSDDACVKYFGKVAAGSTRFGLSNGAIKETPITLTGLPTQRKIGCISRNVDAQIVDTEDLISKYQCVKQGIMTDLFSRGIDPATGELRPSVQEAPELYYDTQLGFIPKGWVYGLLKRFVRAAEYGISTSLNEDMTGIPVLRMNNIQSNRFDVSDLKYTKVPDAYRLKLRKGDVLYNRTNSMEHVGKTALWRGELDECSFASYLVRLNLHEDQLRPAYFAHWMSQVSSQNALRAFATPAVQQVNINPTNLQRIEICCPGDPHEQDLIVERIDALDDNIAAESANLMKLQAQKAGLMRDLLTGKVPVSA